MTLPRLTTRFLLVAFALFVGLAFVAAATFLIELEGIVGRLGRAYALERADLARTSIADLVEREAALAQKLADSPVVQRWMLDESNPSRKRAAVEEMNSYRRAFLDPNYFVVVGASRRYYNQPGVGPLETTTLNPNNPNDQWYFEEVAAGRPVVFNLQYDRLIGKVKVWINCLSTEGGKVIGMAGTGIDITSLIKQLTSAQGEGASAMLVDSAGVITAHPNASYLEYNGTTNETSKKITVFDLAASHADRRTLQTLMAEARRGKTAVARVDLQGHSSLTAIAPISHIGWMIVVSVDVSSLVSLSDFRPLFLVLVISILAALTIIALLINRMVLRPLGDLTSSAQRIAAGDYSLLLPIERGDEIGGLSAAFNDMTVRVREYTENLEGLVKKRTAELAEANRQVMEGIRYARFIQDGLMPPDSSLAAHFASYSFFHRQRDTVGGDFLFLRDTGSDGDFLLAVVDCEGHGVSGALMTMMAESFLQLIAADEPRNDPGAILTALEREVRASFRQDSDQMQIHGGMDIGLCACLKRSKTLVYAGAGVPLYVRDADGTVTAVKGRRKAIGYRGRGRAAGFENTSLPVTGRTFFLLTDGFIDQAGGAAGRAYGTRRLFERIAQCDDGFPFPSWEKEFDGYRGTRSQRDDALAIGFRLL